MSLLFNAFIIAFFISGSSHFNRRFSFLRSFDYNFLNHNKLYVCMCERAYQLDLFPKVFNFRTKQTCRVYLMWKKIQQTPHSRNILRVALNNFIITLTHTHTNTSSNFNCGIQLHDATIITADFHSRRTECAWTLNIPITIGMCKNEDNTSSFSKVEQRKSLVLRIHSFKFLDQNFFDRIFDGALQKKFTSFRWKISVFVNFIFSFSQFHATEHFWSVQSQNVRKKLDFYRARKWRNWVEWILKEKEWTFFSTPLDSTRCVIAFSSK